MSEQFPSEDNFLTKTKFFKLKKMIFTYAYQCLTFKRTQAKPVKVSPIILDHTSFSNRRNLLLKAREGEIMIKSVMSRLMGEEPIPAVDLDR